MNGHGVTLTSFIVTICNVLYKPARKYFGKLLFGALMRPGTISSWSRGHAEGLVKRMYEQLTRIGLKDESLQNAYALWLIESLELYKVAEIKLIVDDTPIKRYGKKVQGAGLHHNPTDKANANSCCYGHSLVMISIVIEHSRWKSISTPLRWRFYVRKEDLKSISAKVRPSFQTKLEIAAELFFGVKKAFEKAGIDPTITLLHDRGYVSTELWNKLCGKKDDEAPSDEGKEFSDVKFRVVTRFKKNSVFYELPEEVSTETKRRGRPRLYGEARRVRDIVADPSIPLQQAVFNLYGSEKKTCVEYKSQVLTSRIAKGSPILVVVSRLVDKKKGKVGEWGIFVSSDTSTLAEEVIKRYALRFGIEELFKDLKQDCGLGLQQTRRYERSQSSASIVIAGYSLVEVWSFDQDENELKSLRNVWDDMERRPSHRDKLCAMRKKQLWELYFEQYTDRINRDLLNEIYDNLVFYVSAI